VDVADVSWRALFTNEALWVTAFAWVVTAALKVLITLLTNRKLLLVRFLSTGGMPSTHTAPAVALTTIVGILYGLNHPYFTFGVVLSFVVMYDATNLRQEAGKHAEAINILFEELISVGRIRMEKWKKMQELLGHTYWEVGVGGAIGFLCALLGHYLWGVYLGIPPVG
jgi:acid phosphatase family membrane protein YuiD